MLTPLARLIVRLSAWLAPSEWRARWREEWLGEIERAAASGRSRAAVVFRVFGAPVDVLVLRWTHDRSRLLSSGLFDIRYAVRSLARARWFTIGAALTFALGIGVNLAVFTAEDRILFRALPFGASERLVLLRVCNQGGGECSAGSFPDQIAENARDGLQHLGPLTLVGLTGEYEVTTTPGDAPPLRLTRAWPNLLRVLRVAPAVGRDVRTDEMRDGRQVALLSDDAWERRFGRDPDVLGRPLGPAAESPIVIGVLPPDFIVPAWGMADPDWEGIVLRSRVAVIAAIARLRDGSSHEAAQDEITAFVAAMELPSGEAGPFVRVDRLGSALFDLWTSYAWLVTVAAALVLLMAWVNLAGLLLARERSREHDVALRTALGATRARVVGTSVVETVMVCVAGAGVSLIAVSLTTGTLRSLLPAVFGRYLVDAFDPRVVTAAVLAALTCGAAAGVVSGLGAARVQVSDVLRRADGAGRHGRLRGGGALLAVESALGVVLVLAAALAIRSFLGLALEDPGYQAADLYRVSVTGDPQAPRATDETGSLAEYREMLQVAAGVPGVIAVAGGDTVMATGSGYVRRFAEAKTLEGFRMEVDAGFFEAIGTRLTAGREFGPAEIASLAPVAVLNRNAVEQIWPGVDPSDAVGRVLHLPGEPARTIVGVVPRLIKNRRGEPSTPLLYVPLGTQPRSYYAFLVRMADGLPLPVAALRERIAERLGPKQVRVASTADSLGTSLPDPRFRATLFGVLGLCALLLAASGLFALTSFEVSRRRYEMGVRMVLGASREQILGTIMFGAIRPVLVGVVAGSIGALWLTRFLQEYLYVIDGRDPLTLALVAGVLLTTATLAALGPARLAMRTSPTSSLRAE